MSRFVIVDTDDGFEIVDVNDGGNPIDAAYEHRGFIADDVFYASYDEAYDAMCQMQEVEEEGESAPSSPNNFQY